MNKIAEENFHDNTETLAAILRQTSAVIFDFYNTLVVDDLLPIPLWQFINNLGYQCNSYLAAAFEPDAFDGMSTPSFSTTPGHSWWLRSNMEKLLLLSRVPDYHLERTTDLVLAHIQAFTAKRNEGTLEVIAVLKDHGFRVGLCSNWEYDIHTYLADCGIEENLFDGVITSANIGVRKPNAEIFLAACQAVGARPDEALFVGDNWTADIAGALRAGLSAVWIQYNSESKGLNYLVPEFCHLTDCLQAVKIILSNKAL